MKFKFYRLQTELVLSGVFVLFFTWYSNAQCNNDPGTINKISSFVGQSNRHELSDTIFLCWEDRFYLDHNDDYNVSSDPVPATPAGIGYGWYKSKPTVSGDNLIAIKTDNIFRFNGDPDMMISVDDLDGDALFKNSFYTGFTPFNNAVNGTGNPTLMYYAPITVDQRKGERGYHENNGPCVKANINEAFPVVYLNPITISDFQYKVNGDSLQASFVVQGGLPEYYKFHDNKNVNYTSIDVYDFDNPSQDYRGKVLTPNITHNDRVVVKFPRFGEYKVIISDGVSCSNTNKMSISNGLNPTLYLDTLSGKLNETICVTLRVRDFENSEYIFGRIDYDPTVLEFVDIISIYPDNYTIYRISPGLLILDWNRNPGPIPDNQEIVNICFKLVGKIGDCSPIIMSKFQATFDNKDFYPNTEPGLICIDPPDGLYISATYCGSETNVAESSIFFKVYNGVAPYSYVIKDLGGTIVQSGTISDEKTEVIVKGLYPGSYTIEVTDTNGDFKDYGVYVSASPPLVFDSIFVKAPTCFGYDDGKIIVKVKDGAFYPYNIKWSNNIFDTDTLAGLGNGIYGVTIEDKTSGCKTDTVINLETSKLILDLQKLDDASCKGLNDARLLATASGSNKDANGYYTFEWQSENNTFNEKTPKTSIFNNASPGWNYIKVYGDKSWCNETDSVFVDEKYTMNLNRNSQDPTCFGDENGWLSYEANLLGYPNDNFNLEFPVFPHPPYSDVQKLGTDMFYVNNLGSGRYIVKIYEQSTGCFEYDTVRLFDPPPIGVNIKKGDVGCSSTQLAYANFSINGGTKPYALSGIGRDTIIVNGTNHVFYDLSEGVYTVNIADANGCDTTVVFDIVKAPGLLNIDTIKFDLLGCDATATTDIVVEASSDYGPIIYRWADTLGIDLGSTTNVLSNVGAGTYIVIIVDNKCTVTDTIVIPEPQPFTYTTQATPSECGPGETGGLGGSVCINIDGGGSGYTFDWNNGLSGACINDVPAGTYVVTISDDSGCSSVDSIEVPGAPPIEINVLDVQGISCNDGQHSDGSAIIQVSGGDNPSGLYVFTLDNGTNKVGSTITLKDLPGGKNHFSVYYNTVNGNSCIKSDSFEVAVPEKLTLDLLETKTIKPTCYGDCDGSIIVKAKGGNNTAYFYKWQETGQTGAVAVDLCAGTYHIEITDANLCSIMDSITLIQPEKLIVSIDSANTKDVNCSGLNSGQVSVNFSGGNTDGQYTFNWSPDVSDSKVAANLAQGIYTVTVSDYKGCSDYVSYEVKGQQPIVFKPVQAQDILCFGDPTCIYIDTVYGGAGPDYTFSVNGGAILPVDSCKQVYASDQPYLVSVFDSEGCKSEQEILISQPEEIIVDLGDEVQLDLGDPQTIYLNTNTNISQVIWDIDTVNFKYHFLNNLKTEVELEGYANDTIYATVIDQNGCTSTGALYVIVNTSRNVYIPNIFTPDGDGLNDEFRLTIGKGVERINYLKIYDRWGELMYQEQNLNPSAANTVSWDGRFKGKRVNPGVYVYLVEVVFLDGRVILYRGAITLIR